MAKRDIRVVTASDSDVVGLIDHGADVDVQIKNLTSEDKAIKKQLGDLANCNITEGELSIRLAGKRSVALVSGVEKVDFDVTAPSYQAAKDAIDKGILWKVVDKTKSVNIPPAELDKAIEVLKQAGINIAVVESIKVSTEALDSEMAPGKTASKEYVDALNNLKNSLKREVTFKVKYEMASKI
jgi:hypothetical protein